MKVEVEVPDQVSPRVDYPDTLEGRLSKAIDDAAGSVRKWAEVIDAAQDRYKDAEARMNLLCKLKGSE